MRSALLRSQVCWDAVETPLTGSAGSLICSGLAGGQVGSA